MKVSFIIPCYNEQGNVVPFLEETHRAFLQTDYEYDLIFVNDGSKDDTYQKLRMLHEQYPTMVSIVNFSRNFGKEAAIYAGLQHARGDYATIIDADLQQRPEVAIQMLDFLEKNPEYDAVAAYQEQRIEKKSMSWMKGLFYKFINKVSETDFYPGASDFRTLRQSVVQALVQMPEYFRFSKGLFAWVGFETYYMPYKAEERNSGESKWSFMKLVRYAIEGFLSFTTFPLKVANYIGAGISAISIIYMIVVIIQKLAFGVSVPGYPTIVVLILFLGGIQLMILGILGEYLARIYIQGKNRPVYIEKNYIAAKCGKANEAEK